MSKSPAARAPLFLGLAALAAALLALVGRVPLALDALAAFLPQIAVLAALVAAWSLARGRILRAAPALAALGIAALGAPQVLRDPLRPAAEGPVRPLVFVTANVFYGNRRLPELISALDALEADVLVTVETPRALWDAPGVLAARYPHRLFDAQPGRAFGVALWSSLPFASDRAPHLGGNPRHVLAGIDLGDGGPPLRVMGLHMDWPVFGDQARIYDDFDRFWGRFRPPGETVVAGDFNAAPWSALTARVAAVSGTRPLDGLRMTWRGGVGGQAGRIFVPGGLPIDQVLLSPRIGVRAVDVVALPGSDHRAVRTALEVPLERALRAPGVK